MQKSGYGQAASIPKKVKKTQEKAEQDRLKQAEKKKRRLEKALATSAAIRSELEKKKQKKLEEQQRLDEEGAAIAESVALHVLVDREEDSHDPLHFSLNNSSCNPWFHPCNIDLRMGYNSFSNNSVELYDWGADTFAYSFKWKDWDFGPSLPIGMHVNDFYAPYNEEIVQGAEISAGLLAAQAVSSLQIEDDMHDEPFSSQ